MSECKTNGNMCRMFDCGLVGCRAPDADGGLDCRQGTVPIAQVPTFLRKETPWRGDAIEHGAKDTNPKDAIAGDKVPLDLCPDTLIIAVAMCFVEGGLKYGKSNWTIAGAKASVYHAALLRHLKSWNGGEDTDPDSGLPHLWKAAACLAILIDCTERDNLVDDRPPSVDLAGVMRRLSPQVKALVKQYGDRNPRHYTIADTPEKEAA